MYLPAVLASFVVMGLTLFPLERRGYLRAVFLASVAWSPWCRWGCSWSPAQPGIGALAALLFVFFCGFNVLEASQPSLASRIAPPHARGAALGVYNTLQSLGFFAGGAVGGWLAKNVGIARLVRGLRRADVALAGRGLAHEGAAPGRSSAEAGFGRRGPGDIIIQITGGTSLMASVNKVILVGNCGRDPEIRYLPSGQAVANVSIATSSKRKDKNTGEMIEETQWHRVTFFDRLAEIAGEYVKKGRPIYVEGRLKYGKFTNKDGVEQNTSDIIATEMQLLGGREGMGGPSGGGDEEAAAPRAAPRRRAARRPGAGRAAPGRVEARFGLRRHGRRHPVLEPLRRREPLGRDRVLCVNRLVRNSAAASGAMPASSVGMRAR